MNEQAAIADLERNIQGDLEQAIANAWKGHASEQDIRMICWAAGISFETIKRQEAHDGK